MTPILDPPAPAPLAAPEDRGPAIALDPPASDATRREALAGAGALTLGAFLAGCGDDAAEGERAAATRTIRHAAGTTQVPARPSRVATLSEVVVVHLASVGLLAVAANDSGLTWARLYRRLLSLELDPSEVTSLGTTADPDLETLAAVRPEVILAERFSEDLYPQLSRIAPTVLIQRPTNAAWKQAFDQTVRAVGREREAQAVRDRYARTVQRLRRQRTGTRVSFVRTADRGSILIDGTSAFAGSVAAEAGIPVDDGPPGSRPAEGGFVELSGERLREIAGDLIVTADYADEPPHVEELRRNPLWEALPAVRAGRVVTMPGEIYNGGTYVAARLLLERLAEEL